MELSSKFDKNIKILKERLAIEKSFDIVGREWTVAKKKAYLVFIDGFAKDQIMLFIMERLADLKQEDISINVIRNLLQNQIAYIEVDTFDNFEPMETGVLSGGLALFVEGQRKVDPYRCKRISCKRTRRTRFRKSHKRLKRWTCRNNYF